MLDALHTAIVARLSADIVALQTCAAYPKLTRQVVIPAVLLDLDELVPEDYGNEVGDFMLRFVAYCIVDPTAAGAELAARNLAAEVAVRAQQEGDFGFEVETGVDVVRVGPDDFRAELEAYLVWSVEFTLGVNIGESVWSDQPADDISVTTITVGDLGAVDMAHQLPDPLAPAATDTLLLPDQPKG